MNWLDFSKPSDIDHYNRRLFVEAVNKFNREKVGGNKFRIEFITRDADEDTMIVMQGDLYSLVNTHMNSIGATAHCLSNLIRTGACSGCTGKLYRIDELPKYIKDQLKKIGWM